MITLPERVIQADERGRFVAVAREPWAEVNFIETKGGVVRGGHYHERTKEMFFVISGEIDIVIDHVKTGEHHEFRAVAGDRFIIEPFELHSFHVRTDAKWLNLLSVNADEDPDFHRPAR